MLLLHVLIALASLVFAAYACVAPARRKLRVSYGLTSLTLLSGTYLVVSGGTGLVHACISGLVYLTAIIIATVLAHAKLERQRSVTLQ